MLSLVSEKTGSRRCHCHFLCHIVTVIQKTDYENKEVLKGGLVDGREEELEDFKYC